VSKQIKNQRKIKNNFFRIQERHGPFPVDSLKKKKNKKQKKKKKFFCPKTAWPGPFALGINLNATCCPIGYCR
jgi:hypothetical protein